MTQYDYNRAHLTLESMLTPDLQMDAAYKVLAIKITIFATQMLTSSLKKQEVWMAHFSVYIPAVIYSFPVFHHTKKQLDHLQSPAIIANNSN